MVITIAAVLALSVVVLLIALGVFAVLMLHRNERVYQYQKSLLEQIERLSDADIKSGRDWHWRLEAFKRVTYGQMLYQFWKRLDSFYPDKSFLN